MIGVNFGISDTCWFVHEWQTADVYVEYSEEIGGSDIHEKKGRVCLKCGESEMFAPIEKRWMNSHEIKKLYCLQVLRFILK